MLKPKSLYLRELLLITGFCQLASEFHSISLFLWPINHSCAKPDALMRSANLFKDSTGQQIDIESVQQNLFDASTEDIFTVAKAQAISIYFDDISHCLEYPVDYGDSNGNITVNMVSLETCRYGLHYEELDRSLSIVSHFNLGCSRQWLKVFLPQSFGLGILIGFLLSYGFQSTGNISKVEKTSDHRLLKWTSSYSINNVDEYRKWNLLRWSLAHIAIKFFVYLCACQLSYEYSITSFNLNIDGNIDHSNGKMRRTISTTNQGNFALLLVCILLRSVITASCLSRVMSHPASLGHVNNNLNQTQNQGFPENCHRFITLSIVFLIYQCLYVPIVARTFSNWLELNDWLLYANSAYLLLVIIYEINESLYSSNKSCEIEQQEQKQETSSEQQAEGVSLSLGSYPLPKPGDLSLYHTKESYSIQGLEHDRVDIISWNCPSTIDQVYPPTSRPIEDCHLTYTCNRELPEITKARKLLSQASIVLQFYTLSFCIMFNYLMLRMMPNHKLLHPETVESMIERRSPHSSDFISDKLLLHTTEFYRVGGTSDDILLADDTIFFDQNSINSRSDNLDMVSSSISRRIGYATKLMDLIQNSDNLFDIALASITLTGWPLELLVISLHIEKLFHFHSSYFRLTSLLSVVKFTSCVLFFEWLVIGKYVTYQIDTPKTQC